MTKQMWTIFCFLYISEMTRHFLTLGTSATRPRQLLFSDGHGSRLNFRAAWLLDHFGVDLLIFLPHTTHAGQPIDVATAAPTKVALSDQMSKRLGTVATFEKGDRGNAGRIRQLTIDAFISAMQKGCSPENIQAGFRAAGLIPGDREQLFLSARRFLSQGPPPFDPSLGEGSVQGNYLLTSADGLEFLAQLESHCSAEEAIAKFGGSVRQVYEDAMRCDAKLARLLTPMPPVFRDGVMLDFADFD
jgi:hypothetical protein